MSKVIGHVFAYVVGVYLIYIGIDGLITGQIDPLARSYDAARKAERLLNPEENLIHYCISVIGHIAVGVFIIYLTFSHRNNDE